MGSDQSRSCLSEEQPGAPTQTGHRRYASSRAGGSGGGGGGSGQSPSSAAAAAAATAAQATRDRSDSSARLDPPRRARPPRRRRAAVGAGGGGGGGPDSSPASASPPSSDAEGEAEAAARHDDEDGVDARALNFNRDYDPSFASPSAAPLTPSLRSSPPSELQIGVLALGDDDEYNAALLGPMRARNKGGMGVGSPASSPGGHDWGDDDDEDGAELDEEGLRAFAFKGAAAAQVQQLDFEYELGELGERLGADLKLLAAGFDEALASGPPFRQPLHSSYHAYMLGPQRMQNAAWASASAGMHGAADGGLCHPSASAQLLQQQLGADDRLSFGSEYQPAPVPFSAEELALQKAAAQRRRRKIVRELHWQRMKKEAKQAEKEAARRRQQAHSAEPSVNSRSGASSARASRHSRRPSSMLATPAAAVKRPGLMTGAAARAGGGHSGANSAFANRSTFASPQKPAFGQRG